MSDTRFMLSDTRIMSDNRFMLSDTRFMFSDTRFMFSYTRFMLSDTRLTPTFDVDENLAPDLENQIDATKPHIMMTGLSQDRAANLSKVQSQYC